MSIAYDDKMYQYDKSQYENFCIDLNVLLNEYIKARRDVINELLNPSKDTVKRIDIIAQRFTEMTDNESNYCLTYYLSNKESYHLINNLIKSNIPIQECCRKIILNGLRRGFKNLRKVHNLTVEGLYERLKSPLVKISPSTISKIENGYIKRLPRYELIEKIKRVFNCDEEYIFGIIDFPKRHGNMKYSPIRTVTFNSYANIILSREEYDDINRKLAYIYSKKNNGGDIEKIRKLLDSLVSDDEPP